MLSLTGLLAFCKCTDHLIPPHKLPSPAWEGYVERKTGVNLSSTLARLSKAETQR